MPINASGIKSACLSVLEGMTSQAQIPCSTWTAPLAAYLMANVTIIGTYSGVTTTTPPVAVTLPAQGKMTPIPALPAGANSTAFAATAISAPNGVGLITGLVADLAGTMCTLMPPLTGIGPIVFTPGSISFPSIPTDHDLTLAECLQLHQDMWDATAQAIYTCITGGIIAPIATVCSAPPSTGVTSGFTIT